MFGAAAFGEFAFGEHESDIAEVQDAYAAWLAQPAAERCWLLEVDAFSLAAVSTIDAGFGGGAFGELAFGEMSAGVAGGEITQYWSTHGYISHQGDVPDRTSFDGRLQGDLLRVERAIGGDGAVGGLVRVYAEAILLNDDGGLDRLPEAYALDGRAARLYLGPPAEAKSAYGLVFSGVVRSATTGNTLRLELSDGAARLEERLVNPSTYAGTGGLEGGDDLKGKQKPYCAGRVKNVPAVLVDGVTYQVSDGPIEDVPAVYDRGILLTKVGGVPSPGEYSVNTTLGTFTLGAAPDGTVTADVEGDASGAGYTEITALIVRRILLDRAALASGEIDPVSFAAFQTLVPAPVGDWYGTEPVSCAAAVDRFLANVGAFGGFSRGGQFTVARLSLPTGAPAASYTEEQIGTLEREPLPGAVEPAVWRVTVGWQRNYTVQTDLASAVTDAQRAFAAEALRVAEAKDAAIKSRRRLAVEYGPGPGLFAVESDAEDEADRLFAIWGAQRTPLKVPLPLEAILRDLGQVVRLQHARHGLGFGRDARVIATRLVAGGMELGALA